MRKFLTARWQDLIMANYLVSPEILQNLVPCGTELDFWEGECYASLVAFKFIDTAVLGFRVPFHINFEEINLRFYVRREIAGETRRGVVFVKEIVPRRAICFVANALYGEKYEAWRTGHKQTETSLAYFWSKGGCNNQIAVKFGENSGVPETDSHGEFIIEHYWGYTKRGTNRTDEYKVEHPKWELKAVKNAEIAVDFGATYGREFAFLNKEEPRSILLAEGSPISVYKGAKIIL
ncbi:MAG TPA: DUF2071 domain-containing protein [Pyrinomonadaceae bacterium]|nr:DUF2071 domain-containing protein [Pyrinomonadaceae bacterium]